MYQPNRSDIRPLTTAWRQSIIDPTKILSNDKQLSSGLVQKELCRDRAARSEGTGRRAIRMHFERIYFVVHRKENILVNQAIAKCTAHPPPFETGQMCSFICIPLIFKRLKEKVHPEVNSLKRLSSACIESERPLLLRKE